MIDVHAHEPETIYVVPIKSDSEHYPMDGKLRVYRSRTGGNEWEPLTKGLPQQNCYVNVLRDAMAVDALDPCGVYFGTTGGQVYGSADAGDTLGADRARPAGGAVGGSADAAMIRVVLPAPLRMLAKAPDEVALEFDGAGDDAVVLGRASRIAYPVLQGTIRDQVTHKRRPFVRFFACEQDLSHAPPDTSFPPPVAAGTRAVPDRRRDRRRLRRPRRLQGLSLAPGSDHRTARGDHRPIDRADCGPDEGPFDDAGDHHHQRQTSADLDRAVADAGEEDADEQPQQDTEPDPL